MNLREQKIGRMLMVGFDGLTPPDYILEWLAAGRISGVILFARNVESPAQLAALTRACHEAAPRPIFISIDQEGGLVARLRAGFTESPGAMALGAAAEGEALAARMSQVLAVEMRALGLNWNYAPVVDVTHDINNPSVGVRSVGTDPAYVARVTAAQVRGFQAGGVAATAKHFPGLGNTPVDTHEALAVISGSVDYLWDSDLVPFRAVVAAGVDSVMVSHVKFEALDADHPATLSPVIVSKLLRQDIGFDGVAVTDCMEMKAVADHYGPGESAVLAALAGVDMILFSHTRAYQEAAYDALLSAAQSGRLPLARIDEAVGRIEALIARRAITMPPQLDLIRTPAHLAVAQEAARAGCVLLRDESGLLPLDFAAHAHVGLIEFASVMETQAIDQTGLTGLATALQARAPQIESVALTSLDPKPEAVMRAAALAETADLLIVATRSAHLIPPQLDRARALIARGRRVIHLCLRNPYDLDVLPGADTVLCTCGDSAPSIAAAVDALLGDFTPSGRLPVEVARA